MSNMGYFAQKIMTLSIGDLACATGSIGKGAFPQSDICASVQLAEIQLKFNPWLRSPTVGHVHCHLGSSEQVSTANASHRPIVLIWRSGSCLAGTTRFHNHPPGVPTDTLDTCANYFSMYCNIFWYFSSYWWRINSIECWPSQPKVIILYYMCNTYCISHLK